MPSLYVYCILYTDHFVLLPPEVLVRVVPLVSVPVVVDKERLLYKNDVVLGEAEAVKEGGAVLVTAGDGGNNLCVLNDHCT